MLEVDRLPRDTERNQSCGFVKEKFAEKVSVTRARSFSRRNRFRGRIEPRVRDGR
jgi:hypothetical protein